MLTSQFLALLAHCSVRSILSLPRVPGNAQSAMMRAVKLLGLGGKQEQGGYYAKHRCGGERGAWGLSEKRVILRRRRDIGPQAAVQSST